jgi:hypothetical protein
MFIQKVFRLGKSEGYASFCGGEINPYRRGQTLTIAQKQRAGIEPALYD